MRHNSTLSFKETKKHYVIPTITPLMTSVKSPKKQQEDYPIRIDKQFYKKIINMAPRLKASVSFNSLNFISEIAVLFDAKFGSHPDILKVFLHNGKNNEVINAKVYCKRNFLNNLEVFITLQEYFERIIADIKTQVRSPLNEIGKRELVLPKVTGQDGSSNNTIALNQCVFANTWFSDYIGTKFNHIDELHRQRKRKARPFINMSGLNLKLKPKRIENPSAKSSKDVHSISLRSEFLERTYPGISDCVEIVANINGNIVIRPREEQSRQHRESEVIQTNSEPIKKPAIRRLNVDYNTNSEENNSIIQQKDNNRLVSNMSEGKISTFRKGVRVHTVNTQRSINQENFVTNRPSNNKLISVIGTVSPTTPIKLSEIKRSKPIRARCSLKNFYNPNTDNKKLKDTDFVMVRQSNYESLNTIQIPKYVSNKEATEIVVYHKDHEHHVGHVINKILAGLNQFIAVTFKNKDNVLNTKSITQLAKALSLELPTGKKAFTPQGFKDKELTAPLKEKLLKLLSQVINLENEINISGNKVGQYRFYITTRNNGVMVRSVLKQRWWWCYGKKEDENLNLLWTEWSKKEFIQKLPSKNKGENTVEGDSTKIRMCNHIENHYHLSNKKAMFYNMSQYYMALDKDPFDTLPLTFHIRNGLTDPEFLKFTAHYQKLEEVLKSYLAEQASSPIDSKAKEGKQRKDKVRVEKNVWILKPGENTNRGKGIQVLRELDDIKRIISEGTHIGQKEDGPRTFILQKYIERPLLINKRKFDIRMFGLITSVNGLIKGYYYDEGYLRTSSKEYTLKNLAKKTIHLTNDAVQMKAEDYGKYENGNKLSFADLQKYFDTNYTSLNIDFYRDILTQIKVIFRIHLIENHNRYI